jgi:hypothetical protein
LQASTDFVEVHQGRCGRIKGRQKLTAVFSFAYGSACKVVVHPRLAALVQMVRREVRARDADLHWSAADRIDRALRPE